MQQGNRKENMNTIRITVSFGHSNRLEKEVPAGTTVGQVVNDANVRAALGYPQNVRPLIHRIQQDVNSPLSNGDEIVLETVGTSKAS